MPITTPDEKTWNRFWSREETVPFTQVSWSKRRILKVLKEFLRPGGKALDAGCGSGFFSKYFCDQSMMTVSVDHCDRALAIAAQMTGGRAKTVKADLLKEGALRETGGGFDLIFSDGLLEHFSIEDQDKILRNFLSMLAKDGCVVTFVPNRFSPWELIRPFFMPGIEETPFVLKELISLNERNHLNVIRCGGVNTFPFSFSPDGLLGASFGMLLYTVSSRQQ